MKFLCTIGALLFTTSILSATLPEEIISQRVMDAEFADMNNDGHLDLVLAVEWAPNHILLGDGKGRFLSTNLLPKKSYDSEDIAIADFDNDGDLDLVFASEDNRRSEFYLNNGKGKFTDAEERLVEGTFNSVIAEDVNSDGNMDIIFGAAGRNILLINKGKGFFKDESHTRLGVTIDVTQDIEAGDIDGDGDKDLVFANEGRNRLLINDGRGYFNDVSATQLSFLTINEETREADFADLDGDGDLDLALANVGFLTQKPAKSRVLMNNGKGWFTPWSAGDLESITGFASDIDLIDIDGDTDIDMLLGGAFTGGPTLLLNNGKGIFTTSSYKLPRVDMIDSEIISINQTTFIYLSNFTGADRLIEYQSNH